MLAASPAANTSPWDVLRKESSTLTKPWASVARSLVASQSGAAPDVTHNT